MTYRVDRSFDPTFVSRGGQGFPLRPRKLKEHRLSEQTQQSARRTSTARELSLALLLALCATRVCGQNVGAPDDPYGPAAQSFPLAQQQFAPNGAMIPGPPGDVGTPTRPVGWPGGPGVTEPPRAPQRIVRPNEDPAQRAAPATMNAGAVPAPRVPPAAAAAGNWGSDERSMQFDLLDVDGARVIARVGSEVIQEFEVKSYVDEIVEANAARIPPKQLAAVREKLTRDRLNHLVEVKLCLVDAQRKIPTDAYPKIVESVSDEFEAKEVRKKLKDLKLGTRGDLEAKFREHGSSLEREKQTFIEQQIAFGWIAQQTKTKHEATHEDMLAYYLEHIEDYSFPAQARWEELRVRTSNYPTREAARQALAQMGDAVLRGANFAEVARKSSQGPTAANGGQYDWTSEGSMAWEMLDQAIFGLPVGRLSQILDDGRTPTISIVRVIERKEAGRTPFTDVQTEIKDKLANAHTEKDKQKLRDYLAKLREDIPVWTIYDDVPADPAVAGGASSANGAQTSTSMRPAGGAPTKKSAPNPYLR